MAFAPPERDRFTLSMLDIFCTLDRAFQLDELVPFPLDIYRLEIPAAAERLVRYRLDDGEYQKAK